MKLVDDKLQERLLDYLDLKSSEGDQEAKQLKAFFERKRAKKIPKNLHTNTLTTSENSVQ